MHALDIIVKKRDGGELSEQEIDFFIQSYTRGEIPDYQAAAWAMAVLFRGMTRQETIHLTMSMARSGDMLDLHDVADWVVDKHSTGGVGDKTTLVVGPLVSACGLPVGKMSGRGLGFSGGTLDKLEAIPGYNAFLSIEQFKKQLCEVELVVAGQTHSLAPADGKLYALRDVTGTVPAWPLIASSVMSKKIAAGADAIVLDVKVGRGAFMKTLPEARQLAQIMVEIGQGVGRQTAAIISDMNRPLGRAVGNALEVVEAVQTLRGQGPADLTEHCLIVAEQMLILGRLAADTASARQMLLAVLADGRAMAKLEAWIAAQGGDVSVLADPCLRCPAAVVRPVLAPRSGVVAAIDALEVGIAALHLGAGRLKKGDPVNPAVGVVLEAQVGQRVRAGDVLLTVHAGDEAGWQAAREQLEAAYCWVDEDVPSPPLVYEVIRVG